MHGLKTLIFSLGLVAPSLATPTTRTSDYSPAIKQNVTEQIKLWQDAIDEVNKFVDTVLLISDPEVVSEMAEVAFAAANEESTSNTVLSTEIHLDPKGEAAALALPAGFDIIGPAINDTIYQPQNVQKNVAAVNGARCAPPRGSGAISLEGDVQMAAASAVGIEVPPPQTPVACYLPAPTA